jgi:Tol biopolymer transport system component
LHWDLSPDGKQVAIAGGADSIPGIQVLSFPDHAIHEVRLDRNVGIADINWAPDGGSWYIVSVGQDYAWSVLRVMPDGRTIALIPAQAWMYSCAPSPDGRYVVYTSNTGDESLWLLEDF